MSSATTHTAALPPQSFALDRTLFNETLYTSLRSFWFAGISPNTKTISPAVGQRWFGGSEALDAECRNKYEPALLSIAPSKLALPPFKSHAADRENAAILSAPFLPDLESAQHADPTGEEATRTLLSMLLLLDQMPRNIYRTPATLPLVYNHYDRLALALRVNADHLTNAPSMRGNPLFKSFFALPLMHAEDKHAQDLSDMYMKNCQAEAREDGDEQTAKDIEQNLAFGRKHADIIEQFGRFPHRNESLERESTKEETKWLETGDTFGVKQKGKDDGKHEL